MAVNGAFMPCGKTFQCQAPTANTAVTIAITSDSPCQQYRLANHSSTNKPVYIRVSSSNVAAVLPTSSGGYAIPVPVGISVITGPQCGPNTTIYFSVIAEDNGAEAYITPGEGL